MEFTTLIDEGTHRAPVYRAATEPVAPGAGPWLTVHPWEPTRPELRAKPAPHFYDGPDPEAFVALWRGSPEAAVQAVAASRGTLEALFDGAPLMTALLEAGAVPFVQLPHHSRTETVLASLAGMHPGLAEGRVRVTPAAEHTLFEVEASGVHLAAVGAPGHFPSMFEGPFVDAGAVAGLLGAWAHAVGDDRRWVALSTYRRPRATWVLLPLAMVAPMAELGLTVSSPSTHCPGTPAPSVSPEDKLLGLVFGDRPLLRELPYTELRYRVIDQLLEELDPTLDEHTRVAIAKDQSSDRLAPFDDLVGYAGPDDWPERDLTLPQLVALFASLGDTDLDPAFTVNARGAHLEVSREGVERSFVLPTNGWHNHPDRQAHYLLGLCRCLGPLLPQGSEMRLVHVPGLEPRCLPMVGRPEDFHACEARGFLVPFDQV